MVLNSTKKSSKMNTEKTIDYYNQTVFLVDQWLQEFSAFV